ncbi:hypothetical protein BGZ58_000266 [Dissophora ornata]|nr:hypothetical protein BGZ58_000266 [Dissophora ornata]
MEHHDHHHNQQTQQTQQPHLPVHCFWALMTYGDLRFIYLSSSVQRAVSVKYKQLLGESFFDYIHPDEAKLARKDLNAFMDVHNLYGSVTRCRFKNVCPEWQQRRRTRQSSGPNVPASVSAAALQAAAAEIGLSSRGLGRNGLQTGDTGSPAAAGTLTSAVNDDLSQFNNDKLSTLSEAAAAALSEAQQTEDHCEKYEQVFRNSEEDEFIILDVVMNVVSDEVVLGFFHIDGQGLYKGFWSNGICGESKESLPTLAPEIMRHLRDSVVANNASNEAESRADSKSPPTSGPRRQASDQMTKRIFQLYDSQNRNLLLTWPEPGTRPDDPGTMAYNPELYTQIVKSHHIPADALENTTCLKRFCSKHALPNLDPNIQEPSYQVESVFIPYGKIIFACFQTTPTASANSWTMLASPATSTTASHGSHLTVASPGLRPFGFSHDSNSPSDHLSSLGVLSSPGQAVFGIGSAHGSTSSALNSPLVIPSLPSLSPFLKPAVAGQTTMAAGQTPNPSLTGPIRSKSASAGSHSSNYHPYSRSSGLSSTSSASSSPSNLPLPDAMQESLSFLNDYKPAEFERGRNGASSSDRQTSGAAEGEAQSMWHASTPHPAIAAMVGHALAPSSPSFQRTVVGAESRSSHGRQKSSSTSSTLATPAELRSTGHDRDLKARKLPSSPRHPAHDAAIRNKSSSSASSSSPPASYQDADSNNGATHASASGHGGHVLRAQQEEKACESCGTTNSPEWRRGQSGKKDLCNACGLRYSRSVARQNRQAQKQLEGKAPKAKAPKSGKIGKTSPKKGASADAAGLEPLAGGHATQASQAYLQDLSHPQQSQQQQQGSHPTHAYPSDSYSNPGVVSTYPLAVSQPSFYHGQ